MRTTLTLEADVARKLKELARRQGQSFKAVVNEAIRRGLSSNVEAPAPFVVVPHDSALRPGIDASRLNQLVDELEVESAFHKEH